jgi:hypothetical protein
MICDQRARADTFVLMHQRDSLRMSAFVAGSVSVITADDAGQRFMSRSPSTTNKAASDLQATFRA